MICTFCGNMTENKRAIGMYMQAARITYIDCPECGCALSIKELRAAVRKYNEQFEEKRVRWITIHGRHIPMREKDAAGGGGYAKAGLTTGGGSGIIHYSSDIVIEDKKIVGYLLNPEKTHYKDFIDIGYSKDNPQELYDDIVSNFNETKAVNHRINYDEYDTYSVFMELGVDKKARFRTVWEIKNKGDKPRLVSAHREDE